MPSSITWLAERAMLHQATVVAPSGLYRLIPSGCLATELVILLVAHGGENSYNMPGIRRAAPAQRSLALKAGIVISTRALCSVTSNDNYSGADSNIDASRVGTSVVPGLS